MGVTAVNDGSFQDEVINNKLPVVVDFWASWCGPCKAIAPYLDEISDEMSNEIKIVKLNVDENFDTASAYGISALPTLLIFSAGAEIARHRGATTKSTLADWIKNSIKA